MDEISAIIIHYRECKQHSTCKTWTIENLFNKTGMDLRQRQECDMMEKRQLIRTVQTLYECWMRE